MRVGVSPMAVRKEEKHDFVTDATTGPKGNRSTSIP